MSRAELIAEMRDLSERMLGVAVKLDYFGGFDREAVQHAAELAGASGVVLTWVDGMSESETVVIDKPYGCQQYDATRLCRFDRRALDRKCDGCPRETDSAELKRMGLWVEGVSHV